MQRRSKRILRVIIILFLVIITWPYLRNKKVDTFDMKVDKAVYAVNGDEIGTDSLTVWLRVDCIPTSQGTIEKAILKVGDLDTVVVQPTTILTGISSLFGDRQGLGPLDHSGDVCIVGFRISGFDIGLCQTSGIGYGRVFKIKTGTM
jgi:hypothetical protein